MQDIKKRITQALATQAMTGKQLVKYLGAGKKAQGEIKRELMQLEMHHKIRKVSGVFHLEPASERG